MGKSSINGPCSMAMLNNQRVNDDRWYTSSRPTFLAKGHDSADALNLRSSQGLFDQVGIIGQFFLTNDQVKSKPFFNGGLSKCPCRQLSL